MLQSFHEFASKGEREKKNLLQALQKFAPHEEKIASYDSYQKENFATTILWICIKGNLFLLQTLQKIAPHKSSKNASTEDFFCSSLQDAFAAPAAPATQPLAAAAAVGANGKQKEQKQQDRGAHHGALRPGAEKMGVGTQGVAATSARRGACCRPPVQRAPLNIKP